MSELPEGWVTAQLSDIGQIVTGKTPSTKESRFYGGDIPFIKPGDLDYSSPIFSTETYLTGEGAAEVPSLPSQSIVVTCIGNLGKVGLTTTISATNQQINAVIPHEGINPTFIFHYCKTLKPWLETESSATTISIVNKGIFSTAPISLPPLAEQTRVAQKLDELLAQVDTLKARIDAIPTLLKRFRQSVLAAAVSGRLTEDWRTGNSQQHVENTIKKLRAARPSSGQKYEPISFEELPNIPDSWIWTSLSFLVSPNEALCYGVVQPGENDPEGIHLIRAGDLHGGSVDMSQLRYISLKTDEEYKRSRVQGGEILVTVVGAGIGESAIVPMECKGFNIARAIAKIPVREVSSKYVHLWLSTSLAVSWMKGSSREVARPTLNLEQLKTLPVPLPALEEQTEIVRRVEQLFAFADQLEAKVASAKSRIDHLTQSILAKAFRGELVPQDPNDEPASVLLARIQTQRAAAPKAKRGRKASA